MFTTFLSRNLQVAMLVSAQREAGEAAEAAARSIVKAALEDPRQFLGRQTRSTGENIRIYIYTLYIATSSGSPSVFLRQDNVTCVVAMLKWEMWLEWSTSRWKKDAKRDLPMWQTGSDGCGVKETQLDTHFTHQTDWASKLFNVLSLDMSLDDFDRTGLSFEDVCPLDGKHVPRISVLPGSLHCD